MLHHAFPPLGGKGGRDMARLMGSFSRHTDIQIDHVTISDKPVYQSDEIGGTVVTHRLNVYRRSPLRGFGAGELFEYQAKSYLFILRTSRKVPYDLVHAMGIFPEGYTAYAFRDRFPYLVSLLPSDEASMARMTGGRAVDLAALSHHIRVGARRIFDHRRAVPFPPPGLAKRYAEAYRSIAGQVPPRARRRADVR